ncbi:Uncharacterised protein [uncultured archaeon]|nr:Uncharacterised protein [uncultured archaeon]
MERMTFAILAFWGMAFWIMFGLRDLNKYVKN